MKDRLKKKLKAKKMRHQAIPHLSKNLPEQYKKHLDALTMLTNKIEPELKDGQSGKDKKISGILDKGMESVEKLYIIMKHQMPHLFDEFKKTVLEGFTPEEVQEFQDRIEHLEATQLDEILAGKK
jgi:hypothetical protein